jgi:hypothetical protein
MVTMRKLHFVFRQAAISNEPFGVRNVMYGARHEVCVKKFFSITR